MLVTDYSGREDFSDEVTLKLRFEGQTHNYVYVWRRYVETEVGGGVKDTKAERTACAKSWCLDAVWGIL